MKRWIYWPPGYLCGGQQRWQHRLTFRCSGRCLFKGKWAVSVILTVIPPKKIGGALLHIGVELVPWKCDFSWLETKTVVSSISFFRLFLDTFTRFGRAFTSSTVSAHVGFLGGRRGEIRFPVPIIPDDGWGHMVTCHAILTHAGFEAWMVLWVGAGVIHPEIWDFWWMLCKLF